MIARAPTSLILSTALLLAWHGERVGRPRFEAAASAIDSAVAIAIKAGKTTKDIGGRLGTASAGQAVADILRQ